MPEVAMIDRRSSWARSPERAAAGARPGWAAVHNNPAGAEGHSRRGAMRLVPRPQEPAVSRDDLALLALLATGMPAPRVARTLEVSDRTIRRRVRSICDAIGVDTPIEAVAWAARRRLI